MTRIYRRKGAKVRTNMTTVMNGYVLRVHYHDAHQQEQRGQSAHPNGYGY